MPSSVRVSVIIIFLNAERFIGEAIESVLAQTNNEWELLLVDDGSTDGSTATARHYAGCFPGRIHYLEHEGHQNCGMSASRNLGIAHARAEFVAFLDADDCWLPAKLADQVAIMDAHPAAAMVYGRTLIWHSWAGAGAPQDYMLDLGVATDTLVEPPTMLLLYLHNRVQTPTTCNALFRREVFDAVGGFHDAFRGMFEDQVFFYKVALRMPIFVAGACWAWYRQHPESCYATAKREGTAVAHRRHLLDWTGVYLQEQGTRDRRVWKALNRELRPYRYFHVYRVTDRLRSGIRSSVGRITRVVARRVSL